MITRYSSKNFIHLNRVLSTNSFASELLSKFEPLTDGTVIMADEQTNGRGQQGSFWESEPNKNISMSLVYFPDFLAIDKQFNLSIAISLGIYDFLSAYIDLVTIKWPNDIYVRDKKIAGVLIENSLIQSQIKSSIIGIGININQLNFSSAAPNPTSLMLETGEVYIIKNLVIELAECIDKRYESLKQLKFETLKQEYLKRLYRFEEEHLFEIENESIFGKIIDIEPSGQLILEINKHNKSFSNKEIRFVL